jgi:hypothetical protein
MKKFLLNEVTEAFLYASTFITIFLTLMLGMCEAPDSIGVPVGSIALGLFILSLYYAIWRDIMREKGF